MATLFFFTFFPGFFSVLVFFIALTSKYPSFTPSSFSYALPFSYSLSSSSLLFSAGLSHGVSSATATGGGGKGTAS